MSSVETMNKTGWNLENSYARLPHIFYKRTQPTAVKSPRLVILNEKLAAYLGLNQMALKADQGVAVLAGNALPQGALSLAQAYAGHQFGYFTMLGDGRALLIGEQITGSEERFDIQLKGSGRTPFSRQGDGRASLGPMLREYIIREAMHALGIPTTRSLAVVLTGESVYRETLQPGAVLARVASSHMRVGTFEYAAHWGSDEDLRSLADYTLQRHFPKYSTHDNRYLYLLEQVVKKQASLIAQWQLVGFVHGVMNTDNMAISGETIDYGPCAFMDAYDPATVFSSIDTGGRYAYGNQPAAAGWNLARFAESLLPLLHDNREEAILLAQQAVSDFERQYHHNWLSGMRSKLGLFGEEARDEALINDLLNIMHMNKMDYTNTFRSLTYDQRENLPLCDAAEFGEWHKRWQARLSRQHESIEQCLQMMRSSNPAIIPRNHRVEAALEAAANHGDYSVTERLLDVLLCPFSNSLNHQVYTTPPDLSAPPYRTFCGT